MNPVVQHKIAQHLEIKASQIVEIREWAWVYWVKIEGRRPTLVSKKVIGAVYVIGQGKVFASFAIEQEQALIAYTDIRGTQWERISVEDARRRWRCLARRGWQQAA